MNTFYSHPFMGGARGWVSLIHRILHSPFLPEFIHLLHDRKGFLMRHHRGFKKSLLYASFALKYLILIACHHIGRLFVCCHEFIVAIRFAILPSAYEREMHSCISIPVGPICTFVTVRFISVPKYILAKFRQ